MLPIARTILPGRSEKNPTTRPSPRPADVARRLTPLEKTVPAVDHRARPNASARLRRLRKLLIRPITQRATPRRIRFWKFVKFCTRRFHQSRTADNTWTPTVLIEFLLLLPRHNPDTRTV